jgi:hypothetical protein
MDEKYFKQDAKQIVDQLFDSKMFISNLTRDDLNSIEDLIGYLMQSRFDSCLRIHHLAERIRGIVD